MVFDWRYAFHSFWFLLTYLILSSTAVFFNQGHALRMALGAIFALLVVDVLFTRNYPYFSRVGRQGVTVLLSIMLFAMIALLSANFDPNWPSIVWDFTDFCLAAFGGTIDGYLVQPTKILPYQTRRDLIKKALIIKNNNH